MLDVNILLLTSYLISSMNLVKSIPQSSTELSGQNIEVKFAIIVDAGSSGSRMFVYTWKQDIGQTATMPNFEIFTNSEGTQIVKKKNPGLSSFSENINGISEYISELLDVASNEIPTSFHKNTPVYIFATAGMRLLPNNDQERVWTEVRRVIKTKYQFQFTDQNAKTINGKEEALFGWIAVNYLLDRFDYDAEGKNKKLTHGMLDMGGASMQIAYEITTDQKEPLDSIVQFSLPSSIPSRRLQYKIYVVSYLNFGANEMRKRYEQLLLYRKLNSENANKKQNKLTIEDRCLLTGLTRDSKNIVPRSAKDVRPAEEHEAKYDASFQGNGDYTACENLIKPMFNKGHDCGSLPCAVGDTAQPEIDYQHMEFYGLTEFFYSFEGLARDNIYKHDTVVANTQSLCAEKWDTYEAKIRQMNADKSPERIDDLVSFKKLACFKATYLISMLHVGLNIPKNYSGLHPITHLDGTEVQWSMGAMVYLLNAVPDGNSNSLSPAMVSVLCISILCPIVLVVTVVLLKKYKPRCCQRVSTDDVEQGRDVRNSTPPNAYQNTSMDKKTLAQSST